MGGTSKSSIYLRFPIQNHPFWGAPLCGGEVSKVPVALNGW